MKNDSISTRIISGVPVSLDKYPWFAKAMEGGTWGGCGGMLVCK